MKRLIYLILIFSYFLAFLAPNILWAQQGDMKILKISGSKFAANKGLNQGVTTGSIYLISRNNFVIGKAEVIAVKENICALKILELKRNINIGDKLIIDKSTPDESELLLRDLDSQNYSLYKNDRTESWYTYWGLGLSSITYPSDIQSILNYIKANYNPANVKLCLDMLGFYFHLNKKLLIGFVINGVADRYVYANNNYFQINQYNYGLSFIRYLNRQFGSGLFLRSDIGLGKYVYQSNIDGNYSSDNGFGLILGGGYSVDLGGTRLLFNLNYGYRRIENQEGGVLSFSLGGLF